MSLYDYDISKVISGKNPPFYALIMAAMRQADSINVVKLQREWPEVHEEIRERYNSPRGLLKGEE